MNYEMSVVTNKPTNWPANAIECKLDSISSQFDKFKEDPNYKNKEVLVSLVSDYDLNQRSSLGLFRTTEYEVAYINSLFIDSYFYQFHTLRAYLYELIGNKTRMQKSASWLQPMNIPLDIKEFEGLAPPLKLYYYTYQQFTVEKNKSYALCLLEFVDSIVKNSQEDDNKDMYKDIVADVTNAYISLLNDISYFRCKKRTGIWAFSRDEIFLLFQMAARLIKINGDSPVVRPLKGVLMTSISNYLLKSRNDYNEDYICKYISPKVACESIKNHQVWMSIIENLNDDRERRVVPELFEEKGWNNYSWAENIDFKIKRKYYVSSFSKSMSDPLMSKDYGSCVYGYKDDRISELIAPIELRRIKEDLIIPAFSQVIAFDVIYSREEAKKEIEFLCSIINCFDMNDIDKKVFLEEILQYWILSVKDAKWSHERERRYVLFLYDDCEYNEIDTSDPKFLKLKTSLFIMPDFILGNNPVKSYIRERINEKRYAISMKPHMFCINCLNRDFDVVVGNKTVDLCPICSSRDVFVEDLIFNA